MKKFLAFKAFLILTIVVVGQTNGIDNSYTDEYFQNNIKKRISHSTYNYIQIYSEANVRYFILTYKGNRYSYNGDDLYIRAIHDVDQYTPIMDIVYINPYQYKVSDSDLKRLSETLFPILMEKVPEVRGIKIDHFVKDIYLQRINTIVNYLFQENSW